MCVCACMCHRHHHHSMVRTCQEHGQVPWNDDTMEMGYDFPRLTVSNGKQITLHDKCSRIIGEDWGRAKPSSSKHVCNMKLEQIVMILHCSLIHSWSLSKLLEGLALSHPPVSSYYAAIHEAQTQSRFQPCQTFARSTHPRRPLAGQFKQNESET